MVAILERSYRVTYRPIGAGTSVERTSRLGFITAIGCSIVSPLPPASDALELSLCFGDDEEPVRVDRAQVMWGDWTGFTVEFVDISAAEQRRLRECLWTMSLLEEEGTEKGSEGPSLGRQVLTSERALW
jgi:hypothetical protein